MIAGWVPSDFNRPMEGVIEGMIAALRTHGDQGAGRWMAPGISVGLLEIKDRQDVQSVYAPVTDSRHYLWMLGEAYDGAGRLEVADADHSRSPRFRRHLLSTLLEKGFDVVRYLDGQYIIVVWDSKERVLRVINDRFGGLPLYWAVSPAGLAFASGVRGALMAPGVSAQPDPEAILEAVTFGGCRLGTRTNVRAVKAMPPASILTFRSGAVSQRRYFAWHDIGPRQNVPLADAIDQLHLLWKKAVHRRLCGARKPGQSLSGGLDSRAILAEAAPRAASWTAVTYGADGCDDMRYARLACQTVGAAWIFCPFYRSQPDWLDTRTGYIQQTDGLLHLSDLACLESIPVQARVMDVSLSGFIGDVIVGPTYNHIRNVDEVMDKLPFYGTELGLGHEEAKRRVENLLEPVKNAPAYFAIFESKIPQSINLGETAALGRIMVRKPFVDYDFFDFCQSLPREYRCELLLRERWLHAKYPGCFARIPYQGTGLPVLAPAWRFHMERAKRFSYRLVQKTALKIGVHMKPRLRGYLNEWPHWRADCVRGRIENTILKSGSLCCEILGREKVRRFLENWFLNGSGPTEVVGAMYVYERYFQDLNAHLKSCGAGRREPLLS